MSSDLGHGEKNSWRAYFFRIAFDTFRKSILTAEKLLGLFRIVPLVMIQLLQRL